MIKIPKPITSVLLLIIALALSPELAYGMTSPSKEWKNVMVEGRKQTVFSIFADSRGLIWLGSNSGLYFYDGSKTHPVGDNEMFALQIYAIAELDETLYLASNNGLYTYSFKTGAFEQAGHFEGQELRCIMLSDKKLWVGGIDGLYVFDPQTGKKDNVSRGLPSKTVYSLLCDSRGIVYAGTYQGLARWDVMNRQFHRVPVVLDGRRVEGPFVNCLLESADRRTIYIGTEGHLYAYTPAHDRWDEETGVKGYNVKSLCKTGKGSLLIGTENGLLEKQGERMFLFRHDSRQRQSISGSEVWCTYVDRQKNIWIGHEKGFSVNSANDFLRTVNLGELTGIGEGNDIISLYKDSRQALWIGGTNGVIRKTPTKVDWFRHDNSPHSLSHNHIRSIKEDSEKHVWLCTDGGINRYNPANDSFDCFRVTDAQGGHQTNWVYSLQEDGDYFWIGSYLGGIHYINRSRFTSNGAILAADRSYHVNANTYHGNHIGLKNDLVNSVVKDRQGNIWILLFRYNTLTVLCRNGQVKHYDIEKMTHGYPTHLALDKSERVWCAFKGGTVMFDEKGNAHIIKFPSTIGDETVLALGPAGHDMWVSTQSNMWRIDGKRLIANILPLPQKAYTAILADDQSGIVYLGGTDEYTEVDYSKLGESRGNGSVKMVIRDDETGHYDLSDILRGTKKLLVPYGGKVSLIVSTLDYGKGSVERYAYKLVKREDKEEGGWIFLPEGENVISLSNISMGNYRLLIKTVGSSTVPMSIALKAEGPWYLSWWAILLGLLMIVIAVTFFVYFGHRRRLYAMKMEMQKKELDNAEKKLTFLSNISHDLKTPLSMIMGPVSVLRERLKDSESKKTLDLVYSNAAKLNNMIHRSLELHRLDDAEDSLLIMSEIDVVEFCRGIFETFKENNPHKTFVFHSSFARLRVEADAIKFESAITNLLSNACKYSEEGATISCGIDVRGDNVEIVVSDDGMGIAKEEQNLVFQRLYRSPSTAKLKEGTGVGLYLINKYLEMMHGSIDLYSQKGQGTTFTVTLPLSTMMADNQTDNVDEENNEHKPKVLIVEDNQQIAVFIKDLIKKDYAYLIAENGRAGLSLAASFLPDLIVLDEMMPIMSGLEMVHRLKQNPRLAHIPLVLLTAKSDNDTENESIKLGVDAFMAKPFEPAVLTNRMQQLISARKDLERSVRIEAITEAKPIEAESVTERQLAKIIQVIEENIKDSDMNVNFVCEKTGIPNKQLYRLTKKYIGVSPLDYIRRIRLQKAAMLLGQQRFTMAEVCYMVGFNSPSYFAKCFQKEFGVKPSEYHNSDN